MKNYGSCEYNEASGWARWWCPGCDREHRVRCGRKANGHAAIAFDGAGRPSLKVPGDIGVVESRHGVECVSHMRDGDVVFVQARSSHRFAGQRVAVPATDASPPAREHR